MFTKNGNIIVPLLSGAFILALAAAGYFYLQTQKFQTPETLLPTPTSNTSFPSSKPTQTDETANWKTLKSTFGYEIKYPSTWFVYPATISNQYTQDQLESYDRSKIVDAGKDGFRPGQIKLELGKFQNTYNLSGVEESLSLSGATVLSKEKSVLNTMPVLKVVQQAPGGSYPTYYISPEDPEVFFISIYGDTTKSLGLIDQILSTFKFISSKNNNACGSEDYLLCQLISQTKAWVNNTKSMDITKFLVPSEITCYISPEVAMPPPAVCLGKKNGEKATGYPINYYQSEGVVVSKEKFQETLLNNLQSTNLSGFKYLGVISNDSKAIIVYTIPNSKFLALLSKKSGDTWKIQSVMIGGESGLNDFTNLRQTALEYVN